MRTQRSLFLWLALGFLLADCGYNGISTTGAPLATTSVAGTPTGVARLTPGAPGVTPTATAPPQGAPGQGVIIQTSASQYRPGETIVVTILNRTARTIMFADHQTNCTVVLLQVQAGSLWRSVALCKLMIVTRLLSLGAGKSVSVSLKPAQAAWSAGTYRIAFRYAGTTPAGPGAFQNTFSPLFRVG